MSWPTVRVGDVAEQIRGVTFGKGDSTSAAVEGHVPVLTASNITELGLAMDPLQYIPASKVSARQWLRKNDVVVTASSGSLSVVGRAAIVIEDLEATFGAFCKVLRPGTSVDPRYFINLFRTSGYRARVSRLAAGANINNLRNEDLDALEIPLPPLTEQHQIAALLDQADLLRAKCRVAVEEVDSLVVHQFREVTRPYPRARLLDVLMLGSGKFLPKADLHPEGDVPVYGANGVIAYHDQAMFVDPVLLVGRVGASGAINRTRGRSWASDNAYVVSWRDPTFDIDFLETSLREAKLGQFASKSAQPLISQTKLASAQIAFGPSEVQRAFGEMARRASQLRNRLKSRLDVLDELFVALQRDAFKGHW